MRTRTLGKFLLASIGLALLLAWLCEMVSPVAAAPGSGPARWLPMSAEPTSGAQPFVAATGTPTPHPTLLYNLPMVKQDAAQPATKPTKTAEPTPLPTPTPTSVRPQTSKENAPIVAGALIIVGIIVLAWLFLGQRAWTENR